ncbi:MAG: Ig and FN3 domain-containing protein [Patescibacteria group bacterium]|jgi:hypothetical protein
MHKKYFSRSMTSLVLLGFVLVLSIAGMILSKSTKVMADTYTYCSNDGTTDGNNISTAYDVVVSQHTYADPATPTSFSGDVRIDILDRNLSIVANAMASVESIVFSKVTISGSQYDHCVATSNAFDYVDKYHGSVHVTAKLITELTAYGANGTAKAKVVNASSGSVLFEVPEELAVNSGAVSMYQVTPFTITSPTSGQTLTSSTVTISYTSTKMAPTYHAHYSIDSGTEYTDSTLNGSYQITGVANGSHILRGRLERTSNNSRVAYSDVYVAFSVNAPAQGTAPSISSHPSSVTVTAGQTATFSVSASGTAPLSYQWQKNSANVSGATSSSYTTGVLSTSDSGSKYKCVVTNAYGNATSNEATLTVNAVVGSDSTPTPTPTPSTAASSNTGNNNTGNTGTSNTGTSATAAPQVVVANTPAPQVGVSAGTGAAPATPVSFINVPSSLTAEDFPGDQGGNTTLKWKASTSSTINGYMVYRSTTDQTKDFVNVAKTEKTVLQYIDTKADVGTTFYYFVRAYKGTSESKSSNTVSFASVDNLAPGIPVNLAVTSYSKSIIKLSWTADIDADLSGYILNINDASGANIETVKLEKSVTSYNLTLADHAKLKLATDYQFTLQATDNHNNTSNPSTAVTASFKEAPVVVPTETKTQAQKLLTPTNLSIGGGATLIIISVVGWLIRRRLTRLP